jgi:membrane associated rhomboid family serine protease
MISSDNRSFFMNTFPSSAARIISGEYYRTITALFLHADSRHLIGNIAGLALFGSALCRNAGYGFGTFMILFSGGIGNLLNASLFGGYHISIGASTSVFGSIGALAGCRLMERQLQTGPRQPLWLPIGGAIALFAILGTGGDHTDITAHLSGMAVGLLLGILYTSRKSARPRPFLQKIALFIVMITVAGSFLQGWLK